MRTSFSSVITFCESGVAFYFVFSSALYRLCKLLRLSNGYGYSGYYKLTHWNYVVLSVEYDLFIKICNLNDCPETWSNVIKKVVLSRLLFWYFLKNLIYNHIQAKFQSQGLTDSGFMTRGFSPHPRLFKAFFKVKFSKLKRKI